MAHTIATNLKQKSPFSSVEQEVLLCLRMAASRATEPWTQFLKSRADLSNSQYNVLRILRGSHPTHLTCGDISERMIARDPDVTRLVDGLAKRGFVVRERSKHDRRVVEVGITARGREVLKTLDPHVDRLPAALFGHLGKTRLRELAELLNAAIAGMGEFR